MTGAGFPRARRLKNNSAFKAVIDRRIKAADKLLTVFASPNGLEYSRLGVSVGRNSGGAVRRNALKRMMREVWRQSQEVIPPGCDCVIMMTKKTQPVLPTYKEMYWSFQALMTDLRTRWECR
ncbi:MAG TPA: ribonuclease P protein component [Sedimentisphaerales bacterium]|nr:ribonuclease P protein component [Sedimentisphaerales bacterium]